MESEAERAKRPASHFGADVRPPGFALRSGTLPPDVRSEVRFMRSEDYPVVREWYEKRGLPPLAPELFGHLALIGSVQDQATVCVINYQDAVSPVGVIGWAVADPEAPVRTVRAAMHRTLGQSLALLRYRGCRIVLSRLVPRSLQRMLKEFGGTVTAEHMQELSWVFPGKE